MKKGLKIVFIILGVLLGIVLLDTLQAKVFNHAPFLKIREELSEENTYIDKGLLVNYYYCNSDEQNTTWKWTKYACPVKVLNLECLKSSLGGYITTEKEEPEEESLANLITYDDNSLEYSYIMKSKVGIYAILKTNDNTIVKDLDNYFTKEYPGYKSITSNDYKIYVYNERNDFNLDNDIASCLVSEKKI